MTRFFVRPDQIDNGTALLDADDAHHLRVVLHANPGDRVAVLDGTGCEYPGTLLELGKQKAVVRLSSALHLHTEPNVSVTIAQALPKMADKMEQVLQHGTEIGAAGFRAFASERSLTHLTGERHDKRLNRWQSIIKTAAEQSHRALLPILHVEGELSDVLEAAQETDLILLAHPEGGVSLRSPLERCPGSVTVVVGPESGFTDTEIKAARQHPKVSIVSLGPRILRTETAALALTAQILYALEQNAVR